MRDPRRVTFFSPSVRAINARFKVLKENPSGTILRSPLLFRSPCPCLTVDRSLMERNGDRAGFTRVTPLYFSTENRKDEKGVGRGREGGGNRKAVFDGKGDVKAATLASARALKMGRGKIDERRRQKEKNRGMKVRKPQRLPQRGR